MAPHHSNDGSGFELPFKKFGRGGNHLGPACVTPEIMHFIGNDQLLERHSAAAQFGGQRDGLVAARVAVVIAVDQQRRAVRADHNGERGRSPRGAHCALPFLVAMGSDAGAQSRQSSWTAAQAAPKLKPTGGRP